MLKSKSHNFLQNEIIEKLIEELIWHIQFNNSRLYGVAFH